MTISYEYLYFYIISTDCRVQEQYSYTIDLSALAVQKPSRSSIFSCAPSNRPTPLNSLVSQDFKSRQISSSLTDKNLFSLFSLSLSNMDKAIRALRQRFAEPSADDIQQHPLCRICWTDYEGEDRPVRLQCGHVFGEECIIIWSRGVTPTGRYNGCPWCRAELLPPSLHLRISALCDSLLDLWRANTRVLGGPRDIACLALLAFASVRTNSFLESKGAKYVRLVLDGLFALWLTRRGVILLGWKQALRLLPVHVGILAVKTALQSLIS